MKIARMHIAALMLLVGAFAAMFGPAPAFAGKDDPVFINLTSDDTHNMVMALTAAKHMSEAGHPATLFVNGKAVLILNKNMSTMYGEKQKELKELMGKGVTVLACGHCVQHLGLKEADLLDGVKIATPAIMNETLFKDNTKSLSW
jgi:intracellular sulfur oxidation DsrE/DsrF family protein